jgi:hypothetical protein
LHGQWPPSLSHAFASLHRPDYADVVARFVICCRDDVHKTAFLGCSTGEAAAVALQWLNSPQPIISSIVNAEQCVSAVGVSKAKQNDQLYIMCADGVAATSGIGYVEIVAGRTCSISTYVLIGSDGTTFVNCLQNSPILAIRGGQIFPVISRDDCIQMNSMALNRANSTLFFACSPGVIRLAYWNQTLHSIVVVELWSTLDVGLRPQYQLTFSGGTLWMARTYDQLQVWDGNDVVEALPSSANVAFVGAVEPLGMLIYQPQPPAVGLYLVNFSLPLSQRTPQQISNLSHCDSTRWSLDEPRARVFVVCNDRGTAPSPTGHGTVTTRVLHFDLVTQTMDAFVLTNFTTCSAPSYNHDDPSLLIFICASSQLVFGQVAGPRELIEWVLGPDGTGGQILSVTQVCPGAETDIQVLALDIDQVTLAATISCSANDIITSEIVVLSRSFACSPGFAWIDGSCQACEIGSARGRVSYYNASRQLVGCQTCEWGFISPLSGSESCVACPLGTYEDRNLPEVCSPCMPGFFNNQTAQTACVACAVGRFTGVPGSAECIDCYEGQRAAGQGSGGNFCLCAESDLFHVLSTLRSLFVGTYANAIQQPMCSFCSPGRFMSGRGATVCEDCALGEFSRTPAQLLRLQSFPSVITLRRSIRTLQSSRGNVCVAHTLLCHLV